MNPKITIKMTELQTFFCNPVDAGGNPVGTLPANLAMTLEAGAAALVQLQTGSSQQLLPGHGRVVPVAVGSMVNAIRLSGTKADGVTVVNSFLDVQVTAGDFAGFQPMLDPPTPRP